MFVDAGSGHGFAFTVHPRRQRFARDLTPHESILPSRSSLRLGGACSTPIWARSALIWARSTLIWARSTLIWARSALIWARSALIWARSTLIWARSTPIWARSTG
ncbi:hypothetical protein [Gordonia sp. NPDC003429]